MKKSDIKTLFNEAEEDIERVKEELYRPLEDVVPFSACVFTRRALYKYLLGLSMIHAKENKDSIEEKDTLEKLIEYNSKYSEDLQNIDFSMINCKCNEISEDEEEDLVYCTNVDKVNYCFGLTESVRKILIQKDSSLLQQ